MDDFNSNNQNQFNPETDNITKEPVNQPQEFIPPQAPRVSQNTNIPYGQGTPVPPEGRQNSIPPNYTSPPYYTSNNVSPPPRTSPQPDYYQMTYGVPKPPQAPKQKMSPGQRVFVSVVISLLVVCLVGFIAYIAINSQQNESASFGNQQGNYAFTFPTGGYVYPTEETTSNNNYTQSDAKKETNPNYSGIKLDSKPKNNTGSRYGASYSFDKLQNSVVGIVCYDENQEDTDMYQSQGTGIVLTSDGYIVTNSHVIGNSRTAYLIKVVAADKKEYKAGVVGYDTRTDLAVLKIDAKGLDTADFGDSSDIEITEDVIAIGNPRGINYQNSVTKGIISAVNRQVSSSNNVKFIQTDAAVNPGNSGGPLCNMYGQVIGITSAKIALQEYEGMGFAIPSETVKDIVDDIIKYSYVTNRVKIGITGTAVYGASAGVNGIEIAEITPGGPMDGTGARTGDIITAVDGEQVTSFAEVYTILEKHKEGDKVKVTLFRPADNRNYDVTVTLQADKN